MSETDEEVSIGRRVRERPSLELGKVRGVRVRDISIRFAAGALTSIVSGVLTLAIGARVGGIMLAFPAILGASLTLIEEQEDSAEAREDARGAVIGGGALTLFAGIAALTLGAVAGSIALVLATIAWFAAALLGYVIAWFR
jgi:Protein of unknown function (DUF3147)